MKNENERNSTNAKRRRIARKFDIYDIIFGIVRENSMLKIQKAII